MQKKMINITEVTDFKREVIHGEGLKIVRFCAEWSGPCQIMGPIYEKMHSRFQDIASFYKIDIDKAPEFKKECGITELPTILFYKKGVVIDFITGLISRASLLERLEKAAKAN